MSRARRARRTRSDVEARIFRDIGAELDAERKRQAIPLTQLAARSGVSLECIQTVIRGSHAPGLDTLIRLYGALFRGFSISRPRLDRPDESAPSATQVSQ